MFIYKITNNINGMVYIGRTKNVYKRWVRHCHTARSGKFCYKLHKAIQEFGQENFSVVTIDHAITKEEADAKEMYWIKQYDAIENGYNTSPGGRNGGHYKKVKAVEDELVFDTILEAAKHYQISGSNISVVVDKPHLRAGGQHWVSM